MKQIYLSKLQPERYYHIYNRSNDGGLLFEDNWQYELFLSKYFYFLNNYVVTYAYFLLNNHFHFLVKCNSISIVLDAIKNKEKRSSFDIKFLQSSDPESLFPTLLKNQFSKLFTSYAMIVNKYRSRRGNLFYRPFKRKEIENENHLSYLIYYIHKNGIKHGAMKTFEEYPWSSYQSILSQNDLMLDTNSVLSWFGGKEDFVKFHQQDHIWNIA